ncbi:hypothetical protein GCM10010211_45730 [Streptomyces albospinus]|uniref:Uncharacterized protein n=1 Tax=Streptomyces albospinus TaxID=285515 RepID=A0ABQ2V8Z4_9ACTN|nr:hypothetical protein GCM10010211_45730 [Streptomyces albospinus]
MKSGQRVVNAHPSRLWVSLCSPYVVSLRVNRRGWHMTTVRDPATGKKEFEGDKGGYSKIEAVLAGTTAIAR